MSKKLFILPIFFSIFLSISLSCTSGEKKQKDNTIGKPTSGSVTQTLPLNISVYIDLSDRLTRELTPTQMERDTAIVNNLIDIFINDCVKNGKIIKSNNHFQVFFYPAPQSSNIAQLAKGLNVDLAKTDIAQKKTVLMNMKNRFGSNLSQIYTSTLNAKKWVGSDIWGFFSNKEVDKLCIRKGYRNILVILTDGYLYHVENKIKNGNAYSYILPQTLQNPKASLIVKRDNLSDLEVLLLEVNPYTLKEKDALISTLENWFKGMGVEKFVVSETDLPVNTEIHIDNFFKE